MTLPNIDKILIYFFLFIMFSCQADQDNGEPLVKTISDISVFDEADQVSYSLADGFTLDLWAPGPLIANAVAISIDHEGSAYVAETSRRKSSDLDIRQHRDWMVEDIGLQSIEQTAAFHKEKLATELSDQNQWLEDFNGDSIHDYRDLEVQTEYIRKVYDSDGDGRADAAHLYADGFNSMLTGVGAGVLFHEGEIFYTAAPDVYRLKDLDGDGDADHREVISHGYGIHIAFAGHDMSGLTMGHDGKVYWSIGDMGLNVKDLNGRQWYHPHEGAVMRANPDGSDFEVYAHGLRNPQEIAFDAYGNLISVDNDGDHVGERERFVHIIEGSDSGWRIHWQYGKYNEPYESYKVWMDEKLYVPHFEGQAAYITPPIALAPNGPAGLAYNPGTALQSDWNDYFFASYFTGNSKNSKLAAFKLKPKGSSFEIINETDILTGIVPTGVNFGPDGALFINDWKESYDKKVEGRIWKLDTNKKHGQRAQTKLILQSGAADLTDTELLELLNYTDLRVRQMAQFELVKRGKSEALLSHLKTTKTLFGKLHAVWGYGQLMRKNPSLGDEIMFALDDRNEHVRSQVVKVIGDAKYSGAFEKLLELVYDTSPRVQFFTVEALGKLGNEKAFPNLFDQLKQIGDRDPHYRHAIVYAMSKLDDGNKIATVKDNASDEARMGAVLALRHLRSPKIAGFLKDKNHLILNEVARAINDDASIQNAIPALANVLVTTKNKDEAFLRRSINANLRMGDASSAARLANFFIDERNELAMRLDALWALGYWKNPPVLDRVDNRYRELPSGDLDAARRFFLPIFNRIPRFKNDEIVSMIITVAGKLGLTELEEDIYASLHNDNIKEDYRIAYLGALAKMNSRLLPRAINFSIENKLVGLRTEALKLINKSDFSDDEKLSIIENALKVASSEEKQTILQSLSKIKSEKSIAILSGLIQNLPNEDNLIKLDVIQAAESQESTQLNTLLEQYNSLKPMDHKLAQFQEVLEGGDAVKGRQIFAFNEAAQCLRCHKIQGYGSEVGPPLDHIASQLSKEDLLLSLVDPNARIAPGYGTVLLGLRDDTELVGYIISENDQEIKFRDAEGKEQTIEVSNIKNRESLPSGMFSQESILNKSELRDLMAFLYTLK